MSWTPRVIENNVQELPVCNLMDIAANLRLLADSIDAGGLADMRSCVLVMVSDEGQSIHVKGESCSPYELMGIFEAAKLRVFADDIIED